MLLHVTNALEKEPGGILRAIRGIPVGPSDMVVVIYVNGKEHSPAQSAAVASIVSEIQRRVSPTQSVPDPLSVSGLSLDRDRHEVRCGGELLHVAPAEFSLLAHLLLYRDRVQSDAELMNSVFGGMEDGSQRNTLWVHIHRLRKKLGKYGLGKLIQTVHGVGYILKTPQPPV